MLIVDDGCRCWSFRRTEQTTSYIHFLPRFQENPTKTQEGPCPNIVTPLPNQMVRSTFSVTFVSYCWSGSYRVTGIAMSKHNHSLPSQMIRSGFFVERVLQGDRNTVDPLYKNSIGSQKSILISQVFLYKGNSLF
jgi:hypothetical protein